MRKTTALFTVLALLITSIFVSGDAYAATPDGSNTLNLHTGDRVTITRVSRTPYFTTLGGRAIETNVYQITGGNGVDQFLYCLEHGSGYAPSNAVMNINDFYSWQVSGDYQKGVLYNDTTRQPVPTQGLSVTLKNGYALTQADIFALDTIYQNSYSLKNRINIDWAEVSYATQNAIRAFITDVAGVTWGAESVSYSGGPSYDGGGKLCVGSVKARSASENDILQYSYELYRLAMKARGEVKVLSDSVLKLSKDGESKANGMSTISVKVESAGRSWQVSPLCADTLKTLGGSIDKLSGGDGAVLTLTIPDDQVANFVLDVRSRETRSSGNLYFAIPQNTAYQKMIGMNTILNDNKQETMTFKLLGDAPSEDIPLPVVPKFKFPGRKTDQEPGFDNNVQSGRGDALLDAGFEVYIDGEYRTTFYADGSGLNGISEALEIWRLEDLTPDIRIHNGSGLPNRVTYDETANVMIREIVPQGYLSEPASGQGRAGYREFTVRYRAQTSRDISSDGDGGWEVGEWEEYQYYITPDTGWNNNAGDRKQNETQFINLVQKGSLHLNKTIEKDFDPWGDIPATKTPMEGAKFTIRLVGTGSESHPYLRAVKLTSGQAGYDPWANCYRVVRDASGVAMDGKNGDASFFTTSEFGQIKIYDIPWGTYQIDEIAASSEGYVLEHTNFTISNDGQLRSKDIVDHVIRDELVVYKTDAETGKRIPSAKMAFRLRYMGNPNTPLEERQGDRNYGKYLSAVTGNSGMEKYVFFTDKNGKCAFPYPLQYGEYQLEELVAPDGYYIDEYDGAGDYPYLIHRFTIDKMGENPFEHPAVELSVKNNPVKGRIEIFKTGETITGFKQTDSKYGTINIPVFENKPKDGVGFSIYAKSDVKLPDGIDAPLFVDRSGDPIALDTVIENHALWKNAIRTEEKVMPDGTALSITTERHPDDLKAMSKANLLTATDKPNKYILEYSTDDGDFTMSYKYDISVEYTPDGYAISEINGERKTEYKGAALESPALFPENAYFGISSGSDMIGSAEEYVNRVFDNDNEVSIDYLYDLDLVMSGQSLLIEPPADYGVKYEGFGSAYHTYANAGATEFYTAMWTDEGHTEQVFVKHSNADRNYSKCFLGKDIKPVEPDEYEYVPRDAEHEEMITAPDGLFLTDLSASKFIFVDDEEAPSEYYAAVETDGVIEYVKCNEDFRAWKNIPSEEEYPTLEGYSLMYERLIKNDQIMFENDGDYLIFALADGKPDIFRCSGHGELFDTKIEAFSATLYKSPASFEDISFTHDNGFTLALDSDRSEGKAMIERPEASQRPVIASDANTKATEHENVTEFSMPVTEPTVFMKLNDGTKVGLVYSGGYAFTTIEVPLGNEYPTCVYEGAERSLISNERGDVLSPETPKLDLLTPDASGDRISAELITPPESPEEFTVFRIATRRSDAGGIVFHFADGRKMEISTLKDQNGKTRGHAAVTCFTPTYRYLLGELVEKLTTGSDGPGKTVSSLLPLGKYIVREDSAAKGVLVEDGDYEVDLDYQGNYAPLIWGSASVENSLAAMQINVKKVFQQRIGGDEYAPKAGAVFGVYANEDIAGLKKGSLIGVLVSDKDGVADGAFKAPFGKYYLKELETLPGYELNPYIYPFVYDDEMAESPLKTQFADKGVIVEYRNVNGPDSEVVIKTLKQIPHVSYKINDRVINTGEEGAKAVGNMLIKESITNIDHMATISNIGGSAVKIEFEDGDVLEYKAGDKRFDVTITQPESNPPVEVFIPGANKTAVSAASDGKGNYITAISYSLGLTNITYRADLEAAQNAGLGGPMMKSGGALIYREINIPAGTDKLALEGIPEEAFSTGIPFLPDASTKNRFTVDINALPVASSIEITDIDAISVERVGKTVTLTAANSDTSVVTNKSGAIPADRFGLQPDGSFVENDPPSIAYYSKELTINDKNNSGEFVLAKLDAAYAEGELSFKAAPHLAYRDGAPIEPAKNMTLDKMACYEFLLSDGATRAEVILMPDNTLKMTLDGNASSDFESYKTPVLESQGKTSLIADKQGEAIVQAAASRIKTIDGMTYFVSESRTYSRPSAFAPVTRIELNTADGMMRGMTNDLLPVTPDTSRNGHERAGRVEILKLDGDTKEPLAGVSFAILNEGGRVIDTVKTDENGKAASKSLPEGKYRVREIQALPGYILDENDYEFVIGGQTLIAKYEFTNEKEPVTEIAEAKYEALSEIPEVYEIGEGDIPRIPKTGKEDLFRFGFIPLIALAGALILIERRKPEKR